MTNPSLYAQSWRRFQRVLLVLATAAGACAATASAQPVPCATCAAVSIEPGQALALPPSLEGLDVLIRTVAGTDGDAIPALHEVTARGGRAGLLVRWVSGRDLTSAALRHSDVLIVDVGTFQPIRTVVFDLQKQVTAARGLHPGIAIGLAIDAAAFAAIESDLAPYLDFVAWRGAPGKGPGKPAWSLIDEPIETAARALRPYTAGAAVDAWVLTAPIQVDSFARLIADLGRARRWLPAGLVTSSVQVTCGARTADTYLNPHTLDTIALSANCPRGAPIVAAPAEPGIERIDLATGGVLIRVPAPGAADRFAAGVDVVGTRELSVAEIIARHQAAVARQQALVGSEIATGTLTLTFEAPGFPAPVTIGSQTTIYSGGGRTDLEQRAIRVNGIEFRGGGVPRLPIIEPERVASPPLAIALTSMYRYRLEGRETVDGTPCFVVGFTPLDRRLPLFSGRAWIAADDFTMVKVAAVQTGLRGPIVASEQVDEFRQQPGGLRLLARSDTRQMYEGAAHRTPIHRVLVLSGHEINPADFEARRSAAYASGSVMLRDTPQGYRYLRRESPRPGSPIPAVPPVLAARADRIRTLAGGVIVDPNISMPLPFAGLGYVDFNLFGTGTQLNGFFGGTYGQLAVSVPSLAGSRWQLGGRAFGILSSYNDRAFVGGREVYEEAIRQHPSQLSVWLTRPLGSRVSVRLGYDLDYTRFSAADETAPGFLVPANQVSHGARVAVDVQREGWNASLWWNPSVRSGWRTWGAAGGSGYDRAERDFQRYGVTVARSAVLTSTLAGRLEGALMAGHDLDRFSRYSFGTFDNRLRGYPSALIRYDRGGVARGALAWAARPFVRLDVFLDSAMVHDPGFGSGLRNYTGAGAAIEAPAPFGTLIAVEWGYGFRGVTATGHIGTQVVRVTGYKVF